MDNENKSSSLVLQPVLHLETSTDVISAPFHNGTKGLPREIAFTDDNLVSVIAYGFLFLVASAGNLTVFITLFRNRKRKSRVNLFILHLTVADLIVTFVMVPLETAWHITVAWLAGDAACRFFMFWRTFGFYLSSWILVAISLDRYVAILHPLSLSDADRRAKIMLTLTWLLSIIASIPQAVIFHVEVHPKYSWFDQCVTFNFFPTPIHELIYHLFNLITVYAAPLVVIVISYSLILREIHAKSREILNRVFVFVMCWTPYFVMSAWWWVDRQSAEMVDPKIQRGLFLFAVSNSCMNPLVYGLFTINFTRELGHCCHFWSRSRQHHRQRSFEYQTVSTKATYSPARVNSVALTTVTSSLPIHDV